MASWKRIITTGDDSAYKNSNLVSADIPADAVTQAKIADDAVGADQLATNAVGHPSKLADDVVTSAAIDDGAVGSAAIAANAVGATALNVSGDGTSGYLLASDADGSFSWVSPNTGDITGVTAGTGITGGGDSGGVTLNIATTQSSITELVNSSLTIGAGTNKARIKFDFSGSTNKILFGIDDDTDTMEMVNGGNDEANQDILRPTANRSVALGDANHIWDTIHSRMLVIPNGGLTLNTTAVTATGAELNLLDGVTATTAEINYLDGVTSDIQTQFSGKAAIAGSTGQSFSTNDLNVQGNLTVSGTTTTINTATLTVEDKLIKLGDVTTPTTTTGHLAGIQVETSATEAEWPELKWANDGNLTGWSLSDHKGTSNEDFPVSVMKFGTSAASGTPDSGAGTLFADTSNSNLYIYI